MSYVQGTTVRVSAVFTAADDGTAIEPSEVVLRIERQGEETEERLLSRDEVFNDPQGAGTYYADLDTTQGPPGTWHYQFESTGPTKVTARKALTIRSRI